MLERLKMYGIMFMIGFAFCLGPLCRAYDRIEHEHTRTRMYVQTSRAHQEHLQRVEARRARWKLAHQIRAGK